MHTGYCINGTQKSKKRTSKSWTEGKKHDKQNDFEYDSGVCTK